MWLSEDSFRALVVDAIDGLPDEILGWLDNVEVIVEDWATSRQLHSVGIRTPYGLLGLYEGIPRTSRDRGYGLVLPDKVTLFRGPLLHVARTHADVRQQVRHTLVHELAHHFGIDDDRLEELGAY